MNLTTFWSTVTLFSVGTLYCLLDLRRTKDDCRQWKERAEKAEEEVGRLLKAARPSPARVALEEVEEMESELMRLRTHARIEQIRRQSMAEAQYRRENGILHC